MTYPFDRPPLCAGLGVLAASVARYAESGPTKKFVTVEQVAPLAVFFCSGATAPITGANIRMDGDRTVG